MLRNSLLFRTVYAADTPPCPSSVAGGHVFPLCDPNRERASNSVKYLFILCVSFYIDIYCIRCFAINWFVLSKDIVLFGMISLRMVFVHLWARICANSSCAVLLSEFCIRVTIYLCSPSVPEQRAAHRADVGFRRVCSGCRFFDGQRQRRRVNGGAASGRINKYD